MCGRVCVCVCGCVRESACMCVRLHVRALVGARVALAGADARAGTCTCVRVCDGAHVCVRMSVQLGKGCGVHVRMRVGAHV